ncbi:MAG: ABC transporter ATP-binding protein [Nitrospirae bacterium]|nr:ABC transporter ATP-binding protein [Nitrospirota bacterium]MDA8339168.1 ABC transporter ATP-binding protein [Nitrospiraceae bacterium]
MEKVIHMKNVSWICNGRHILRNINWEVNPGEHWAIIGLNGSGKTTLLNMINGYLWPSTGEISVLDKRFGDCDVRELRKSTGWVSSSLQERLYTTETAEEIVLSGKFATIGLYDRPDKKDIKHARIIMEQLGCAHLAKQLYGTLSQGEKQRVLIARALMSSPKILILDEPCTALDIFAREQLLSTLEHIDRMDSKPTLIYVSHHIEEIVPVFKHTLLLRRGEMHSAGKTKSILTKTNLSDFFETLVNVEWRNGRPWIRLFT